MGNSKGYIRTNKDAWEEAFEHRTSEWGVDIVTRLKNEKHPFLFNEVVTEVEQLDLIGKTIGQFCCNNGRELLSLMQFGAKEGIGFDLADNQVKFANKIACTLKWNCTFIATDVLEIDEEYYDKFDFLFISSGSLCWFKDLFHFFEKVSKCVKKNGIVLISEMHPVTNMLASPGEKNFDRNVPGNIVNSYFEKTWIENDGMYYMTHKKYKSKTFTSYTHSLSAILSAAFLYGYQISKFAEFEQDLSGGQFSLIENRGIPLSFILELKM